MEKDSGPIGQSRQGLASLISKIRGDFQSSYLAYHCSSPSGGRTFGFISCWHLVTPG